MTREKLRTAQTILKSIDACQCIIDDIEQDMDVRINGTKFSHLEKSCNIFL